MRISTPGFEDGTLNAYEISPEEIEPGDIFGYKVVAVVDEVMNAWGAFRGPTSWPDIQVRRFGDRISKEAAESLFPTIAETGRKYRT